MRSRGREFYRDRSSNGDETDMRRALFPLVLLIVISQGALSRASTPIEVTRWAPAAISSGQFESHGAFDPHAQDFYFVRSSPKFEGWRIVVSHCGAHGWSKPESPTFAGDGVEADPWFTPDGRTLYFISTRTTDGIKGRNLDIWRVSRAKDGRWGTPVRLPEPVNSTGAEWFPRLAPDGWLYFGSSRGGGLGKNDIWRARQDEKGAWVVENLGPGINTAGNEYEPLLTPDGTMIFMADGGLWEAKRAGDGFAARVKLPPEIDVNGSEIGAALSPSGRTLLFARDLGPPDSGEFFVAHLGPKEAWPPACPAH
jgi:WD40 repeat protein